MLLSEVDDGFIDAINRLFSSLVNTFGPGYTLLLVFLVCGLLFLYRLYTDWRKDREINLVLAEKEAALQRAVEEAREYRIYFLKKGGWSNEDVDSYVIRGGFKDGPEAREAMEAPKKEETPSPQIANKKGKGKQS